MTAKRKAPAIKKVKISNKWSGLGLARSRSVIIALVFVLIFGGIGVYHIVNSNASSADCVYYTYSIQLQNEYVGCVKDLQYVLDNWRAAPEDSGIGPYLTQDGSYGPNTQRQVEYFQKWVGIHQDGIAGENTWYWLCDAAAYTHFKYDNVGCVARWPHMMAHPYPISI